ncbi:MAG TPA: ATP-binding protein [Candidatus Limnocylindrales bacterium]|jgi:anti-sigma regulatory factor (Ser/Thr protein kinase)|nr:ATP-binding protein [Candidatus Limnocylindrales bacterium]
MVEVSRRVEIPAELERLAEVREAVREVARSCEAPVTCMDDLVQAVDEAVTNIIVHGYRGGPGTIEMAAELVGDDIVITLEDRAPIFDPMTVPPPDLTIPPLRRRPGGMGIHLIRLAMDSVRHRPRPGGGNILTLTRSRVAKAKEG